MREHLHLFVPAAAGAVAALALFAFLGRALVRRGRSRWRAAPLCLPLFLGAIGYGLFWVGFFSSPELAVQLHAVRLTVQHFAGDAAPWLAGTWLAAGAAPLLPLLRRPG